jgi:hypothetical protein
MWTSSTIIDVSFDFCRLMGMCLALPARNWAAQQTVTVHDVTKATILPKIC